MFILMPVLISISLFGATLQQDLEFEETEGIVGGKSAEEREFPWMVEFFYRDTFRCSASIISETTILIAAICVFKLNGEITESALDFYGIIGTNNRSSSDGIRIDFENVIVHPLFRPESLEYNIAVLQTTESIVLSDKVQNICIASEEIGSLVGERVVAMGWGKTNRNKNDIIPEILQYVDQRVITNQNCQIFFFGKRILSSELCARYFGTGICNGDAGGPLVYYKGEKPIQVGIAIYINDIFGCGTISSGVFTRISSFTEFIKTEATGDICIQ